MAGRTPSARALSARATADVLQRGRSLDQALAAVRDIAGSEYGLVSNIAYGVQRHRLALEFLLRQLLNKPLAKREGEVHALLLGGLFERWQMSTPAHAAVSQTVNALPGIKRPRLKGLANAVLRRFDRERDALLAQLERQPDGVRLSHPRWLEEQLSTDWPDQALEIMASNNARAPMWLRINAMQTTLSAYCELLAASGIAVDSTFGQAAICLSGPVPVSALPRFDDGWVSVQDLAPQWVADVVAAKPGMRVLDACAAPGGKSAHLLEAARNQLDLLALDIDAERLVMVDETLDRLGLSATTLAADAAQPDTWWDGATFDRILIDAPCSATGVIRRHPDIKSLRRSEDIAALAERQVALLEALWPLLSPGGCLVYATCSILKQENSEVTGRFCRDIAPEARFDELRLDNIKGVIKAKPGGVQILPGTQNADGFFLSRFGRPD
ncbi:MAG: 16S rRNA (cytosine(967)-C(5))-methyltransferase RsmB [Pseudomonadota bacterium]